MKILNTLSRLLVVVCVILLLASNFVAALEPTYSDGVGGFIGNSYFENAYVGNGANYDWIYSGAHGSNSITGSVMPNWQNGSTASGGGAIGTKALGVAVSESNSQVLKQALYDYLFRVNTNQLHGADTPAGQWDTMGSAVVVHTMLGDKFNDAGRDKSRTISAADWADLKARLVDNPDIQMTRDNYIARENTAGIMVGPGRTTFDAARYTYEVGNIGPRPSWVFRDGSGAIVYAMEIICANPLGNFTGLPDNPPPPPPPVALYDLVPSANSNGVSVVQPGEVIKVDGSVENQGSDPSPGNEWRLIEVVYGPNVTPGPGGNKDARDPCAYYNPGSPPCRVVESGTNVVFSPGVPTVVRDDYTYSVSETVAVGTKICFAVSVRPPTQEAADQGLWRHSNLQCVIVAKSPKMQVWGGDVRSGGKIDTGIRSFSTPDPLTFGSWGEYGALSKESNSGFGSGSGLNNGSPNPNQSSWGKLTFANTGTAAGCNFGCYDFTLSSSTLSSQFVAGSNPGVLSSVPTSLNGLSGVYTGVDVNIAASTIPKGRTVIILATNTVKIQGNITYDNNGYTGIKDIPQVIIRAPKIEIQGNVGQVDAWLLALVNGEPYNGTLDTCSDVATSSLTANVCNNRLVINGPVMADIVQLKRTAGSGSLPTERGEPGETFNLRADAYLWASAYGSGRSRVQTVYTKELSPRF